MPKRKTKHMDATHLFSLPKTEQHVHLEAAARLSTVAELVQKYHVDTLLLEKLDYHRANGYQDMQQFFGLWKQVNELFRTPEDFERITYEFLEDLAAQNCIYAELNLNLLRQISKGLSADSVISAVYSSQQKAEANFGIVSRTLLSISRDWDHDYALFVIALAKKYEKKNVVGIDIAGDEVNKPNQLFVEVFKNAKKLGVNRVAHAGESAGTLSVWSAVRDMHVSRIGHGLDARSDKKLIDYLRRKKIVVELCPSSNIGLGHVNSFAEHPGRDLIDAGVIVTINTDDPLLLNVTLTQEYQEVAVSWKLNFPTITRIARNGIEYGLLAAEEKQKLLAEFDNRIHALETAEQKALLLHRSLLKVN
jgi:adenosine deaminase